MDGRKVGREDIFYRGRKEEKKGNEAFTHDAAILVSFPSFLPHFPPRHVFA